MQQIKRRKQPKRIKKNCLICGKSIFVIPSRVNRTKCCSIKCRLLFRRTQFCPHGHDKDIVGREKCGSCSECRRKRCRKYEPGKIPKKQICIKGHNLSIVGRAKDRHCRKCHAEAEKEYRIKYPGKAKALSIKNNTNRNLRVVAWSDWNNINYFYDNKPEGMVGDHFIPLQGIGIAGLHVSWNLQYLTPKKNSQKRNKCNKLLASAWYGRILEEAGLK